MNKKLITLLMLCSLIIPMGMTGCLDEDYEEPTQELTEVPTEDPTEPTEYDPGELIHTEDYDGFTLSSGTVDYDLFRANYFENETVLMVSFDFIGSPLADGETDYHNYDAVADAFDADWHTYAKDFVLYVDDVAYKPTDLEICASYCYQEDEAFDAGKCSTFVSFPGIDYENAEEIILDTGEDAFMLKDPSGYCLHTDYFSDITLNSGKVDYDLYLSDYYEKETVLFFSFDFIGSPLANGETDYHNFNDSEIADAFSADFAAYAKDFILTVDGTEYKVPETGFSYCYQEEDNFLEPGKCSISASFPAIDYDNAELITLTVGEDVYSLKDGEMYDPGKMIHSDMFNDITLSSGKVDYDLIAVDYYENTTVLTTTFDFTASPLANGETDYHNYGNVADAFDADWEAYSNNLILTVDDVAYPMNLSNGCYCYQDGEYEGIEAGTCTASVMFPAIDYENAEIITLTAGEDVYTLKAPRDYNGAKPWLFSNLDGVVTEDTPAELKDDFYLYVNKEALASNTVSEECREYGYMSCLNAEQDEDIYNMFNNGVPEDHDAKIAYDLYNLAMDWDSRNEAGAKPLLDKIDKVSAIDSIDDLTDYLKTSGENCFWEYLVDYDLANNSDTYVLVFAPLEGMLTDPADYLDITPQGEDELGAQQMLAVEVLKKCGYSEEEAWEKVEHCTKLETDLAPYIPTLAEQSQYSCTEEMGDHISREEMIKLSGQLPILASLEEAWEFPQMDTYIIVAPEFFEQLNALYTEDNLTLMKDQLIVSLALDYAPRLDFESNKTLYEENGYLLTEDDPYYGYSASYASVPWSFQKLYTTTALSQEDKDRISDLTDEIIANYRELLNNEDFISEETRTKAIEKLDAMKKSILFPDDWSKYREDLTFRSAEEGGTYFEAQEQIDKYNKAQEAELLKKGTADHSGWNIQAGSLPSETNCSYSIISNEMFVYGAWAKGMCYSPDMTIEELYATMGETIGHEISHAFDQTGALYDKDGKEKNWWTEEDYAAFQAKNDKLIEYFNTQVEPWAGAHLDGELLAGEACADMGALKVMLMMASKIPDFDYDLFFRTYASSNLREYDQDIAEEFYYEDEHPFEYIRVNMVLQQFDEFLDCYGITEGDGMYLAPEDRVLVW